jgi:hypothetical protein
VLSKEVGVEQDGRWNKGHWRRGWFEKGEYPCRWYRRRAGVGKYDVRSGRHKFDD